MREIVRTSAFKKDMKRLARSGKHDVHELLHVVRDLAQDASLSQRYNDHALVGTWSGFRECHIRPDWLLLYRLEPGRLVLVRSGSHAALFG